MKKKREAYSATVVDTGDINETVIDVRPPFVPSEGLFDLVRDISGVALEHFVTTPTTTRLEGRVYEGLDRETSSRYFQDAAHTIMEILQSVDDGIDVTYLHLKGLPE